MRKSSICDFWADCPDDAFEHPADASVLARVKNQFQRECLPLAYSGRLRTAPVVLLFLSPGFTAFDVEHAKTARGRDWYRRQRTGTAPLANRDEHEPAWAWWTRIVRQFHVEPEHARDNVAILNIGAYHSESFHDWHMLTALPSSRASLNWAQGTLFKEAERGERLVVCLRSARIWGLRKGGCNGGTLYAPAHGQNGVMNKGPVRDEIAAKVRERLGVR